MSDISVTDVVVLLLSVAVIVANLLFLKEDLRLLVAVYLDRRDCWVGYYRGDTHHYVCPLPCVVIRWARARKDHHT